MRLRGERLVRTLLLPLVVWCGCADPDSESGREASLSQFDWTIGTWTGVRRDVADGTAMPMHMRVESLIGGGGQLRTLEVGRGDDAYRGTAVQRFETESGGWVWQYANSTRRPFGRYAGEVDGAVSVWRSVRAARTRESRLISERLPDGLWRRSMAISTDGGKTWQGIWVDELRRTPGP